MKNRALWLSVSALTLVCCGAAGAQTTSTAKKDDADSGKVQEVVVTAERRTSNLQTTPISATVISGGDLVKKGVVTIDAIQFVAPGITVNNFGQGNDFNIRGIGKAEHNSQTTTGVIVYRDGIATFPGYFQEEPYYDIASVEILRGPQGTFVGQNATGGAVFITTNNPVINGGEHGYIAGQLGNYDDVATQGAINLPISDTLAARVSFNAEGRNSFYTVTGPNHGNPGNIREGSFRLGLLWKPTDALTVLFKTDYNYLDMGAYPADPYYDTNNPFKLTANFPASAVDKFVRSDLKIDYVMPNGITLRSISGYQKGNTEYHTDLDGTDNAVSGLAVQTFGDSVDETIYSEELNLISPSTGPLTWVLGGYYQSDEYNFLPGQFFIGEPFGSYTLQGTNPEETAAGFGQVSYNLPAGFQIQVGARYSSVETTNHVTVNQYGFPIVDEQSAKSNNVSGKVALNWTIDPHNFVYAFVATGFRAGGLNVPVGLGQPAPFAPEKITEYEVGWKAGLLGGHLRTQLDAYYNDYRNFQVIVAYPTIPTFGFELNTPNPTKIYGLEAQAEAVFGDLSFDAGLGLMHSQLGTFYATDPRIGGTPCNPSTGPVGGSCIALGGKQQTYAPNFTFNIGGQYVFRLADSDTVTPRLNYGHVSSQWATLFENASLGDHLGERNIFNGQIAWSHGDLVATLYGTNLTDERYVGALNSGLRFEGPPRQYGVRLLKLF